MYSNVCYSNLLKKVTLALILLNCLPKLIASECDVPLKFYHDLKCVPIYDNKVSTVCPSEFDCSHLNEFTEQVNSSTQCYFDGEWYDVGEYIHVPDICSVNFCRCASSLNFECSTKRCPFYDVPDVDNCYLAYELDECCPRKYHCKDEWDSLSTCDVAGTIYKEGELFNSPLDKCKICVCDKRYDKEFGSKTCTSKPCQALITKSKNIANFCAPVYMSEGDCCPTDFVCPDDEEINLLLHHGGTPYDLRCRYGQTYLKEHLKITRKLEEYGAITVTECTCFIPPFLTCYRSFY